MYTQSFEYLKTAYIAPRITIIPSDPSSSTPPLATGALEYYKEPKRCHDTVEEKPPKDVIELFSSCKHYYSNNVPSPHHAYYRFNSDIGKVQMCVVAPWTLLPVRVGCTYVPPPNEDNNTDEFLVNYVRGTRCYYFLTGRTDP